MTATPALVFEEYLAIQQLYAQYVCAVDSADWDAWIELFVDDCVYRIQPRENHERGFPLATLSFDSKGMLRDRAYGISETVFRTKLSQLTTVFNVGRTLDEIVQTEHGLRFQSRLVIYDSELIPNSLIYPI